MQEEKQISGIMMRIVSEEKYRIIHGFCKRTDGSHDIISKKIVLFLYSQPLLTQIIPQDLWQDSETSPLDRNHHLNQ